MRVSDIDETHMRVHGNFRGCLCYPVKAAALYITTQGENEKPVVTHRNYRSYYYNSTEAGPTKHQFKRSSKIVEVTCAKCLMIWDAWLMSFTANPPRPHRDQVLDLMATLPEEFQEDL